MSSLELSLASKVLFSPKGRTRTQRVNDDNYDLTVGQQLKVTFLAAYFVSPQCSFIILKRLN